MEREKLREQIGTFIGNFDESKTCTRNIIFLRRAFGKSLDRIGVKEKIAFLESSKSAELNSENWFIATLCAKQLGAKENERMEKFLGTLYRSEKYSESLKKRIQKLLEVKNKKTLIRELVWFVKFANNNEVQINPYSLCEDLYLWDEDVAEKWAQSIVGVERPKRKIN